MFRLKVTVPNDSSGFDTKIQVENPRTKQSEIIPVTYTKTEINISDIKPVSSNFTFGDIAIVGAIFVLFFAFVYLNQGNPTQGGGHHYHTN